MMHLLCCRGMRLTLHAPALRTLLLADCSFNMLTPSHCSRLESLSLVVRKVAADMIQRCCVASLDSHH